jgi:transaldolase
VLKDWVKAGLKMPDENFNYQPVGLKPIDYKEIALNKTWQEYNIAYELTDKGLEKFAEDWNQLIG